MNTINVTGRLTRDPELKTVGSNQTPVCSFSLAVERPINYPDGRKEVDFIDVVTWRKLAKNCSAYLAKGKMAGVTGRLQVRAYDDSQGVRRKAAEIIAVQVDFLSPRENGDGVGEIFTDNPTADDEDIPF